MPWQRSAFPFRSRYVDVGAEEIHYIDEGAGPVLLFVHPAPASSFMYREFIAGLRDRFRVIALDYPGFGLSSARWPVSLPALARATADFMTVLDLRDVTLCVHDTGGAVGLGAATLAPDRVRAFVLSDAVGFPLDEFLRVRVMLRIVTSRPARWLNRRFNLLPRLVARFGPRNRRLPPDVRAVYQGLFPTPASRDRILDLFRELLDQRRWLADMEARLRAELADRPALIMFGSVDPVRIVGFPDRYREIFPDHVVEDVPGEAHFPHEGSPDFMIEAICRWWDTTVERR